MPFAAWRRYLLVPRLVLASLDAPRDQVRHFPQPPWRVLAEGPTTMYGLPVRPDDEPGTFPP